MRRGRESNPRIRVLQTPALPLGYHAICFATGGFATLAKMVYDVQMKVSFIIPAWNEEKGIVATLEQFKALRKIDHEVIVSDNGSTDTTVELSRQHGARVALRPTDVRTSIGECRNRGAKIATGDILWFIDADVRLTDIEASVDDVVNYFTTHPEIIAAPMRLVIYPEEATFADRFWYTVFNFSVLVQNRVLKTGASPGDCMMILRKDFERLNGFNPNFKTAEDFELFHRLAKIGEVGYIWHRTAAMSPRRIHRDGWLKVLSQWFKNWFTQVVLHKHQDTDWEARR